MAKQTLPTNYQDDVMSSAMGAKRKWQITQNTDGTYNIEDVTTYDKVGTDFGAGDINATNKAVNQSADAGKIIDDPDTAEATTEEGYIAGVQLFNHVNDSLDGLISYPDYAKREKLSIATGTFTMKEDGWIQIYVAGSSNVNAAISNNAVTYAITPANSGFTLPLVPVKKGDIVAFNINSGTGTLYFFSNR